MPELGPEQVLKAARAGTLPSVVLLVGGDETVQRGLLHELTAALPGADQPGNLARFQDAPLARVLDACRTVPMLGGRRIVIARGVPGLTADGDDGARDELMTFVQSPPAHAVLVIVAAKVDGRLAVVKQLEQRGAVVRSEVPSEREMPGWIGKRAKQLGLALSPTACQALADAIGADTGVANGELRKLALLVEPGQPIDRGQVEQALGPSRSVGAFALEDALLGGDARGALAALDRHLAGADGGAPLALLGRLGGILRRLALAHAVVARGGSETEVRGALGVHPFVASKYAKAAARCGPRSADGLAACVTADLALKSGRDPRAALSAVVLAVTAPRSARETKRA